MAETFKEIIQLAFETLGKDEAEAFAASLEKIGDAGDGVNEKLKPLLDQFEQLASTSDKVAQAIDISEKVRANDSALVDAKKALADLNAEFSRTDKSSADIQVAFEQAEKRVRSLAAEQLKLQTASASSTAALKAAGVDTTNLAAANDDLKKKASGVAAQIAAAGAEAKKSGKSLQEAGDGAKHLADESRRGGGLLTELRDNLGKIVSVATAVKLALGGIEFGKESFKEAADLEQSLVRVRALAGEAQQSLAGFESGIEDAAAQAGVSANMAAAAMASLVQQGRSADEALQALVPTLLLAKTAQIDVAQAAGLVDGALSQFGATAADASKFVDILVTASKGSKDGIAGLADGIQKLAPLARDLNLSFQDTVGILGFMTRNGLSAGDATKGLGAIFRDLKNPASDLRQQLFALGDGTSDFDTAIKTLATSGDRGKQALLGLDDSTRKVVLFLQQQGTQGLAQFRASLDNVSGSAAALDKAIGDNLNTSWGDFTRAIDSVGAKLAQPVLEPLKVELQALAQRLTEFAKSPAFAELQTKIGELASNGIAALDNLLRGINWDQFVEGARTALTDASASIASFKNDLQGVATAISVVGNVIGVVYRSIAVVFDTAKVAISAASEVGAERMLRLTQSIDAVTGATSESTKQLEALRDASKDAVASGLADLEANTSKLKDNFIALAGSGGDASAGMQTAAAGARIARVAFDNVTAGVESTRAALQHFDVPPGTFDNVIGGAGDSAKALEDMARSVQDAQRAVDSARSDLDRLARTGETNTDAFRQASAAFDAANARLRTLKGESSSAADSAGQLKAALAALGVTAQQDVAQGAATAARALDTVFAAYQQGKATIEDVRAAFEAYSAKQLEAVKNSDNWKQQQVKDALAVKEAMLGVSKTTPSPDFKSSSEGARELSTRIEDAGGAVSDLSSKAKEGAVEISDAFAQLSGIYAGWTGKFNETSKSAALRFQELTKAIFEFGVSSNTFVQADTTGIAKLGFAITEASRKTQAEIDEQKGRVAELSAEYQGMTDGAIAAMAAQQGSAEGLARSLEAQAAAARNGQSQLELLGASDLSPLASALDGVAAKARQLAQEADSARQSFADLASSLVEQIAQANGDLQQAENVRFQNALENLRKQAEATGTLNSAEYADAVAKTTALHNIKMKQLQDEADAKRKSDTEAAEREKQAQREAQTRTQQQDKGGGKGTPPAPASTGSFGTIRVDLGNGQTFDVHGNQQTATDLQALMRALQLAMRNNGGRPGARG